MDDGKVHAQAGMGFFSWCARHGRTLGGESPLWTRQWEPLAEGKGVHREVESELSEGKYYPRN